MGYVHQCTEMEHVVMRLHAMKAKKHIAYLKNYFQKNRFYLGNLFYYCCRTNQLEVVKILVCNFYINSYLERSIIVASKNHNIDVVHYLLDNVKYIKREAFMACIFLQNKEIMNKAFRLYKKSKKHEAKDIFFFNDYLQRNNLENELLLNIVTKRFRVDSYWSDLLL